VRGAAIAALIAWLGLWLDAARSFEPDGPLAAVPQAEGSRLAAVTEILVEGAVEAAFGDAPGGQLLARLAARPSRLRGVRDLLENPRMTDVQDDAFFWTLVQNGAADRALNRLSFYQVSHDPELRAQLAELGLVSEAAAEDSSSFRNEVREVLQKVGPRIRGLKRDPEIRRLAADPEITAMLRNGDTLGLITHPDIQALATRLATQPDPDA
jgi:hypothetical protein